MKVVRGYRLVAGYLGSITVIIGLVMLLPLLVLPFYPSETKYLLNFLIPGIITIIIGLSFSLLIYKKPKARLQKNQDAIIVVLCWLISFIFCSIPFLLKKTDETYSFTQAIFEVVSGFTTAGMTMVDVENAPHIYLIYRSIILFFGGAGLILVLLSVFNDSYGLALYHAEGHEDRLLSNITKSTRAIMLIYIGYIVIGAIAYIICGMPVFDAINHAMASVSTGGFSTKYLNIGHYNHVGIEIITIFLMLLGSVNFLAHLYLLRGKFKSFFRYNEIKTMLITLVITIILFTLVLLFTPATKNLGWQYNLRSSSFHVVSALTGTGYNIQGMEFFFNYVPSFFLIMIILMVLGGNTGSTSGGIKMYRFGIIIRNIKWKISESLRPGSSLKTMHYVYRLDGREYIDDKKIANIHAFVVLYIMLIMAIAILFAIFAPNVSFQAALFEAASTVSTVGFSMGIVTHSASNIVIWIAIVGMFLGRLEIYIIILCFIRLYRDSKKVVVNKLSYKKK